MAVVHENIFFKAPINKYRMRAIFWVIGAIGILILMVLLWMFSKTVNHHDKQEVSEVDPINSVRNINITNKITELNDLSYSIKPIEFKTIIRDLRNYPDEFKDHRYLKSLKGKWTLQVMNVEAHDVISDYLDSRDDRENFSYFRYTDENNHQRYILIYEVFETLEDVIDSSKSTNFDLPRSVKVIPEEINRYFNMIDNYERAEEVHDLSGSRPRSIVLKKTNRKIPVRRITPKAPPKPKVKKKKWSRKPATKKPLSSGSASKNMTNNTITTKQSLGTKQEVVKAQPTPTKKAIIKAQPTPTKKAIIKAQPAPTKKAIIKAQPPKKVGDNKSNTTPKPQTAGSKPTLFVPE